MAHYPDLRNQHVFITGGGSGIGAAVVGAFVDQGARVSFVDLNEQASQELCAKWQKAATPPEFRFCDLRNVEHLQTLIAELGKEFGPVSVLVNNAAHDERHRPEEVTLGYWEDRLAVNLRHQFFAAQAVAPQMKQLGGGSIINLGSMQAHIHTDACVGYTSSKHAVRGLTQSLAKAWGKERIRVNTVVPGWVMTERQLTLWVTPEAEKEIDANQCLPDRLQPEDIARMVLFLASEESRMCTGQDFIVDAGWVNH
jgi:NAD(P)-dependent dehydrogenase (short-subunit alcohol dehydrogenase family)